MTDFTMGKDLISSMATMDKRVPGKDHDPGKDQDQGATHLSYLGRGLLEILDALPFYVLLIDKNHRILLANKATLDVLGKEASEIVGQACPRVVHGLHHGSYQGCPLEQAVSTNEAVEWEHFDDNSGRWLKTAVYPTTVKSIDGLGVYFHMVQDITEQKEALGEA